MMKYGYSESHFISNGNGYHYRYNNSGKRSYRLLGGLGLILLLASIALAFLFTPNVSLMAALYGSAVITLVALFRTAIAYAVQNEREANERDEEDKLTK